MTVKQAAYLISFFAYIIRGLKGEVQLGVSESRGVCKKHLHMKQMKGAGNSISGERDSLALKLSSLNNLLIFILMYLLVPGWIIMNRLYHFRLAWRANNNSVEKLTKLSFRIEVSVLWKQKSYWFADWFLERFRLPLYFHLILGAVSHTIYYFNKHLFSTYT